MNPQYVLNVNDEDAARNVVTRMLEAAGFQVRESVDGRSCLDHVLSHANETIAIVLDVELSDMNGFEVAKRIREQVPQPRIPIVHLSTSAIDFHDRVRSLEAGANYYLTSSGSGEELVGVMRALVEQRAYESGVLRKLMHVAEEGRTSERRGMLNERDRLFNLSPDLMAITDSDGLFRAVNPAWEKILGYSTEALVGRAFASFIHPDDVASTCDAVKRLEEVGQIKDFVNRYRRSDGNYRHLMWTAVLNDSLTYAMARDITERLETELHASQLQKL